MAKGTLTSTNFGLKRPNYQVIFELNILGFNPLTTLKEETWSEFVIFCILIISLNFDLRKIFSN